MSATAALDVGADGGLGDVLFERGLREFESLHADRWRSTESGPPTLGTPVTKRRQEENGREAEQLLEEVARQCEAYPDSEPARRSWRAEVRERVRRFGEERLGWPNGYRRLLLSEAFYDTTAKFVREARRFDPGLPMDDVMQALRNVWIMNSIQLLLDGGIGFSPAIFAYSMLYPCTDNLLDDPHVSPEAKAGFNRRLGRRLRAEKVLPRTMHEQRAFGLVDRIEAQHSRDLVPDVFRSLRAIHRAQERSLIQQRAADPPDAARTLDLSVAKGGASVLADGYLVAGDLSRPEAELCFGYGVFLQLLDDLQDVREDTEVGHTTLFTIAAQNGTLDEITGRLHRFMGGVMRGSSRLGAPVHDEQKDLVLRNCTFLLVGSIARHRDLFGRSFLRAVEERWPFDLATMRRLQRLAEKRFRRVGQRLSRRRSADSVLALL